MTPRTVPVTHGCWQSHQGPCVVTHGCWGWQQGHGTVTWDMAPSPMGAPHCDPWVPPLPPRATRISPGHLGPFPMAGVSTTGVNNLLRALGDRRHRPDAWVPSRCGVSSWTGGHRPNKCWGPYPDEPPLSRCLRHSKRCGSNQPDVGVSNRRDSKSRCVTPHRC